MTKTIEAKPVREARAAARRMARKTDLTYQQALDRVARDAGAGHWAAYAAMHPATTTPESGDDSSDSQTIGQQPTRRSGLRPLVRAIASGEMAERASAGSEADAARDAKHGFSPETGAVSTMLFVAVMVNGFTARPSAYLMPPLIAFVLVHALRRIARLVGDHPSMAMRRRQVRDAATMGIVLCLAFAIAACWPDLMRIASKATNLPEERIPVVGIVGAAIMHAVRRQGLAVMLLEAPATIPQLQRTSPVSGYVVPSWFVGALHLGIATGAAVCLTGMAVMFLTSVAVLLHIASWPTLYGIGGMAAAAGFFVSGTAYWMESHLRRSGYLEGPTLASRLQMKLV